MFERLIHVFGLKRSNHSYFHLSSIVKQVKLIISCCQLSSRDANWIWKIYDFRETDIILYTFLIIIFHYYYISELSSQFVCINIISHIFVNIRGSRQGCEDFINLSVGRIFIYINGITVNRRERKAFYAARRAEYFSLVKDNFSCGMHTPIFLKDQLWYVMA